MIKVLNRHEVIADCNSRLLGARAPNAEGDGSSVDHRLIGEMVRRGAAIHCPCSKSELRYAVEVALRELTDDNYEARTRIDQVIDDLILVGDLVEAGNNQGFETELPRSALAVGAPSFIPRASGHILIVGGNSENGSLPKSIAEHVKYFGVHRIVPEKTNEINSMPVALTGLGFRQLGFERWTDFPGVTNAQSLVDREQQRLQDSGEEAKRNIEGLRVLEPSKDVRYYGRRWASPESKTGTYVARRPSAYQADIWCYVSLETGSVTRLVDLSRTGCRWRPCDLAWHLQMATDYLRGVPQLYRRQQYRQSVILEFFAPIPLWAERRLMVIGERTQGKGSLVAYELPIEEAAMEEEFLQKKLWMTLTSENGRNGS